MQKKRTFVPMESEEQLIAVSNHLSEYEAIENFFPFKKAIKRLMVLFLRGDMAVSIQRTNIRTI